MKKRFIALAFALVLAPSLVNAAQLTVAWTPAATGTVADNFEVWRSQTDVLTDFSKVNTVPKGTLSFVNTGLTDNTKYFYYIKACAVAASTPTNIGGCSAPSAIASGTTKPAAAPNPVTGVTVTP